MNKNLEQLVELLKISKEELGVDITKDEFTFEEIYNLSLELNLTLRDLFSTIVRPKICYSVVSLIKAIEDGDIEKVKRTILSGYVFNCEDKIYFTNRKCRIVNKDMLSTDIVNKLFELLIQNDEWDIARRLSSKGLFYKFNTLDNKNVNYLLGNINNDILSPDYYSREIFRNLDEESKMLVQDMMVMNYVNIVLAYKDAKERGLRVMFEGENSFSVTEKISDEDYKHFVYFIDDLYKEFDQESQKIVLKALQEIK